MAEKIDSYSPGNSYVVVHVPSEDDYSKKSFYLRTGESIESVVASAGEEFVGEDVELEFNTGTFEIDRPFASEDGVLRIFPEVSPHLTYLVAEGLFYRGFVSPEDSAATSVQTSREPTRGMYYSLTGFVTAIEEFNGSLIDLLADPEEPALLYVAGADPYSDFVHDLDYAKLSNGFLARTLVAMNYGYIYNRKSSFVLDSSYGSDDSSWYVLPNSEDTLEHVQIRHNENAAVGKLSSSKKFTFSEADKVGHSRRLFFDGSVRDLIETLMEEGILLDDELDLDDFS